MPAALALVLENYWSDAYGLRRFRNDAIVDVRHERRLPDMERMRQFTSSNRISS